jgi:hypothetical protein
MSSLVIGAIVCSWSEVAERDVARSWLPAKARI